MANTGDLIGKTYLIPQYQDQNAGAIHGAAQGGQPYDDGVQALQGLQTVQGQTSDYYRKVAALKSFMQDVHNNLGIDVRVPDYTKGEMGIKMNELYNYALADIMAQGNLLKNSHERMNTLTNQRAHFLTNTNQAPVEQMQFGKDYTFEEVNPLVKESNDAMAKALYEQNDFKQAEKIYNDRKQYYEGLKQQHPELAEEYDRQIASLNPPHKGVFRPFNPRQNAYEYRAGRRQRNVDIMLRKAVNLKNGLVDFEPTTKVTPTGGIYETNKDYTNFVYGKNGKHISEIRRNPETNEQKIIFQDGSSQPMPADVTQFVQNIGAGQNMGFDMEDLSNYVIDNKLEGDLGKLNEARFLPSQKEQELIRKNQSTKRLAKQALVQPIHDAVTKQLESFDKPMLWGTTETSLDLGNGMNIEFSRHKNGDFSISPTNLFKLVPMPTLKNGKVDNGAAKEIAKKFNEKPLKTIVTNLLNMLPIEDYKTIYDALNIPLPNGIQSQPQTVAPTEQPSNNDPLGIR